MLKQKLEQAGVLALAIFLLLGTRADGAEQEYPSVQSIKADMKRVADWQIEHLHDDYGRKNPQINDLDAWTYGALYVGMVRWAAMAGDDTYYNFLKRTGEGLVWDLAARVYNADDLIAGQLYLELYQKYRDPEMLVKTKERCDWILAHPSTQEMRFNSAKNMERWTWCDSLFMAPPVWAKLSRITGDPAYRDFMFNEYQATTKHLFDADEHLFFRDEHFFKRREKGRKMFWARGNGWVFGGLALIIPELPDGEQRDWFVDLYQKMAPSVAKLQTEQGHWAMSLLAADIYPTPETSGTAFFTFGLAWGINAGLIDRATYEPVVMKGWSSLAGHITTEGMLGFVQPVGAGPGKAWADKTEVYGTGAFLAAGTEICRLHEGQLIYLNKKRLENAKDHIAKGDPFFSDAYDQLIIEADKQLSRGVNPVTRKSQVPPSGDTHDYLSIAPYRWPNPEAESGFPWILKDGQINPMTRGNDTDKARLSELFNSLNQLSMAYYFSDNTDYADKARSILQIWFIDEATKVNPNINYGQGIPGELEGRRAGIIEWTQISSVVNAIQILSADGLLSNTDLQVLTTWLSDYYQWLKTSPYGIENDKGLQNHSTCYDYQMVGLARYLGLESEAVSRLEAAKTKRIATQIKPNGMQPRELGRTKSVHYCSMNLKMMTLVAEMGMPLGVDLWNYSSVDGRSMRKGFEFLRPFAQGDATWTHSQIGGAESVINKEMKPLFSIASTIFGEALIDESAQADQNLGYMEKLQYPPFLISQ